MSFEPVGVFVLLVGVVCLIRGPRTVLFAFVLMTSLGAASVLNVAGNSLLPALVMLVFLAVSLLAQQGALARIIDAYRAPQAGFWLACVVLYGVLGAFFFPRLFADQVNILPLASAGDGRYDPIIQLQPVSSNFTNSMYMLVNLATFGLVYGVVRERGGFSYFSNALTALAALTIVFALADLGTFATGTEWLMEPIRNADYRMLFDTQVFGLKRVVGSFTEASSFAGAGLTLIGFTATMWLFGERPYLHGALSILLVVLVALSTSSSGLAGLPVVLVTIYFTAIAVSVTRKRAVSSGIVVLTPVLAAIALFGVLLIPSVRDSIAEFIDVVVLSKAGSQSGEERGSWNALAYETFLGTHGIGAGFGSTRSSSLLLALLSNVGVFGLVCYVCFLVTALLRITPGAREMMPAQVAARNACIGSLVGSLVTGTSVDQGLLFYALAAFAAAPLREAQSYPERERLSPT